MVPTMNESQEPDDLEQVIERLLRDPVHGPRLKKRLKELGLSPRAYVLNLCRRDAAGARDGCDALDCKGATQRFLILESASPLPNPPCPA